MTMEKNEFGQYIFNAGKDLEIYHNGSGIYLVKDGVSIFIGQDTVLDTIELLMKFQHEIVQKCLVKGPRALTEEQENAAIVDFQNRMVKSEEERVRGCQIRDAERQKEDTCSINFGHYVRNEFGYSTFIRKVDGVKVFPSDDNIKQAARLWYAANVGRP